jgi:hypothetical protein
MFLRPSQVSLDPNSTPTTSTISPCGDALPEASPLPPGQDEPDNGNSFSIALDANIAHDFGESPALLYVGKHQNLLEETVY